MIRFVCVGLGLLILVLRLCYVCFCGLVCLGLVFRCGYRLFFSCWVVCCWCVVLVYMLLLL